MSELARSFAWRIALCVACSWLAWRVAGPVAAVTSIALVGLLLAHPLLELLGLLRHGVREVTWRPVQGRHWVYRGTPVQVIEGVDHRRWIRACDVRSIVGFTASDGALRLSYPQGFQNLGEPPVPHFSDDALLLHLAKERSQTALKFRHWVEREIAFPARRLRERYGVHEAED